MKACRLSQYDPLLGAPKVSRLLRKISLLLLISQTVTLEMVQTVAKITANRLLSSCPYISRLKIPAKITWRASAWLPAGALRGLKSGRALLLLALL